MYECVGVGVVFSILLNCTRKILQEWGTYPGMILIIILAFLRILSHGINQSRYHRDRAQR